MAYRRDRVLQDALRELNPPKYDEDEVISDSEPEREAQRTARKKEVADMLAYAPVDWNYDKLSTASHDASPASTLAAHPATTAATHPEPPVAPQVIVIDDDEDDSGGRLRKNLAKFKLPTAPVVRTLSASSLPKEPTASRSQSPAGENWQLTDAELNKINTCVGCDASWTSRKTSTQKLAHIRSCVRKRGLTDDTTRALLRAQLDGITPGSASTGSRVPRKLGPSAKPPPTTYLDAIVNDAERKKKPNRSAVPTSVVPVIKAREDILARGSAVLQIDKSNQNIPYPSKTHAASISLAAPYDENFPATQALPASRLATVGSSLGVLRRTYSLSSDEEDDNVYLPPPTQAYAPSKLAQSRSLHTSAGVAASSSPRRRSRSPAIVISSSEPSPAQPSPKARGRPRSSASRTASEASSGGSETDADPWQAADAVFEGGADDGDDGAGGMIRRYSSVSSKKADVRRYSELLAPAGSDRESSPSPSAVTPSLKKKRKAKKNTVPAAEKPAVPVADFSVVMRNCIYSNKQLHERILRYEPIHFDVFAKLALDYGFEKRTLLTRLRGFLDQEAINFHLNQPDAPSSRRRRR